MQLPRFTSRTIAIYAFFAALYILICGVQPLARAQHNPTQGKPILITSAVSIVESAQEPGPVHRATKDLLADFTKVFGKAPKIVDASTPAAPSRL